MLIATQNPISFGGRKPLSPALTNRFQTIKLDDYSLDDLGIILHKKGHSNFFAKSILNSYQARPHLTPRDLFREAGQYSGERQKGGGISK